MEKKTVARVLRANILNCISYLTMCTYIDLEISVAVY